MAHMLHVTLICSDDACAEEFEAWGELEETDLLVCEGCGCTLQATAFAEVHVATVTRLPRHTAATPGRRAA